MNEANCEVGTMTSTVADAINRIVTQFHPRKIILFGSHARDVAGRNSDADLLVVMEVEGSKRQQATRIDLALRGVAIPTEIIVVTPEELERYKDSYGTLIHEAVHEGKVMYERVA
jgi:uncharacterized protein